MTEDQVPNRALLQQRFERYEALAEALCRLTDRPDTVRRLERLRARLRQGPVRLLVVGVSCSGKSTLINALAGEFVAPEGDYVTSCVPLWVSGRRPDPKGPRFRALYWKKDGSFYPEPNNQVDALTQLCHVPNHETQVPEELEAMTAQVSGGFLWDSGLTLVDTPGIGQQAADDAQTQAAIDRGAELLLITHRAPAVSDEDAAFLQSLFPGGEQDLHLDMKRDLFLLGNKAESGSKGTEAGIQNALKKLVFQWNMSGEKRFYWVNVLRQRQRMGYYRYHKWFPKGADDDYLWDREQQGKLAWERLEEARRQVGEQAGEEELIEAEEDLRTQELLEEADFNVRKICLPRAEYEARREAKRKDILYAAPMRKSRALKDSRNMDKLRRALTARALELYEDPDRLCAPIEAELLRAVQDLAEDCRKKIEEKTEQIKQEFAAIPDRRLSSRELTRLRGEDKTLIQSIDRLGQAMDWLKRETRGFAQETEQTEKKYQEWENTGETSCFLEYASKLESGEVPTKDMVVKNGGSKEAILESILNEYVRRRNRVRTGLADGTLPLPEGWVSPEQRAHRLDEILQGVNKLLPKETGLDSCRLPDKLLRPNRTAILAAMGGEKELRDDLRKKSFQQLSQRQEKIETGKRWVSEAAGWIGGVAAAVLLGPIGPAVGVKAKETISDAVDDALGGVQASEKDLFKWALGQSAEGIKEDVQAFIRYQRDNAAEQLRALHNIEHELSEQRKRLKEDRRGVQRDLTATVQRVRGVLLDRQLKEELAPLEQELRQWEQLTEQKNWMEVSL